MKTLKNILTTITVLSLMSFVGCQKEPGPGGKGHIHGHVEYNGDHVHDAFVSIWYDETDVSNHHSGFDDQTFTSDEGEFEFEHLRKGDYFLFAEWEDTADVEREGHVSVTIKKKVEEVEAHIDLQ